MAEMLFVLRLEKILQTVGELRILGRNEIQTKLIITYYRNVPFCFNLHSVCYGLSTNGSVFVAHSISTKNRVTFLSTISVTTDSNSIQYPQLFLFKQSITYAFFVASLI